MACSVDENTKQQLKNDKINAKSSDNIKGPKTPNKFASNVTKDQQSLIDLNTLKAHKNTKFRKVLEEQETLKCQHSRKDQVPLKDEEEYVLKLQKTLLKDQPTSIDHQRPLKVRHTLKEQLMLKSQIMSKDQQLKNNQAAFENPTATYNQKLTKHHKGQTTQKDQILQAHQTKHGQHAKKDKSLSSVEEKMSKHQVIIKKQHKASHYKEPLMNRNHRSSDNQLAFKNIPQSLSQNATNDENVMYKTQKTIRDRKSSLDRHHSGNVEIGEKQKLHHDQKSSKDENDKPLKDHELEKEQRRRIRHQRVSSNDPLVIMQQATLNSHQHQSSHGQHKTKDENALKDHEKEKDKRKLRSQKVSNDQLVDDHGQLMKKDNKMLSEHKLAIDQRKLRHHRVSSSDRRADKDHQMVEDQQTLHGKPDHEMAKDHKKLKHQKASNDQLMLMEHKAMKNHRMVNDQQTTHGQHKTKGERSLKEHEATKDLKCLRHQKASNDQLMVDQQKAIKDHHVVEDQQALHDQHMTKDDKAKIDHEVAEDQRNLRHQRAPSDHLMLIQQKAMKYHQIVGDQQQAKVDTMVVKDQNDLQEQKKLQQQKALNDQLTLMQHTAIKYQQLLDDQRSLHDLHMTQDERVAREHEILNLQKALLDQLLFMQQRALKYQKIIEEDQQNLHDQHKAKDESDLRDHFVAKTQKRLKQQKALNDQFMLMQQKALNTQQVLEDQRSRQKTLHDQHSTKDKKVSKEHKMFNEQKKLIDQLIFIQQKTLNNHQPTLHGHQHKTKDELSELRDHEVTNDQRRLRHQRTSSNDLSMLMQQKALKNPQMLENQTTLHVQHTKKDEKTNEMTMDLREIRQYKASIDQLVLKQKLEDLKTLPDQHRTKDKKMVKEQEQKEVIMPQKHHEKHQKVLEDQETVPQSYQVNNQKSLKDQMSLSDEKALKDIKTTLTDQNALEDQKLLIDQMTPRKKMLSLIKIDTILQKLDKKNEHEAKARKLLLLKRHIEGCSNKSTFTDEKIDHKSKPPVVSTSTVPIKKIISLDKDVNQNTETKNKFKILMELPSCDFRNYFRKWMESDVVARSLQAKLRSDLIENFNKTKLGKELYGITTNTYEPRINAFGSSSLVMAINTLIAEFMFVQNCHFTLSVYCTEVPFRHTLPDFETRQNFRFRDDEIKDLLQTVTGNTIPPVSFMMVQKELIQTYLQSKQSLLFALFKVLTNLDRSQTQPHCSTRDKGIMCKVPPSKITATTATMTEMPATHSLLNTRVTAGGSELQEIATNSKHILEGLPHNLPSNAHSAEYKRRKCNKATNTRRRRCYLVNAGSQTIQTGLEHNLNKHLTDLMKRVRELVLLCQVPIAAVQRENVNQFNFEHLCKRLEQHSASLNVASLKSDTNSLQQLNQIFTNIRQCAQSLEQVLIHREKIPPAPPPPPPPGPPSTMKLADTKPRQKTKSQRENVTHMKIEEITNISSTNKDPRAQNRPAVTEASQQTELATQLCTVATNTIPKQPKVMLNKATNTELEPETVRHQSPEQHQRKEKTYDDWVQEMISTSSGKLFLNRVEASIRKAIVKQNNRTRKLYDIKLKHHREILRIRYKHMSMGNLSENSTRKTRGKTRHLLEHFSRQFGDFTKSQEVLMEKFQTTEAGNGPEPLKAVVNTIAKPTTELKLPEIPAVLLPPTPSPSPQATAEANLLLNLQRKLKKESVNLRNLALIICKHLPNEKLVFSPKWEQCTKNLEKAVADARKTINELKEESNQVEEDFRNYLNKSRAENMAKLKSAKRLCIESSGSWQQKSIQENEAVPPPQQHQEPPPQCDSNDSKNINIPTDKETQDNIMGKSEEQKSRSDESRLSSERKTLKKHKKHRKVGKAGKNLVYENAFITAKRELFRGLSCIDIYPEKETFQNMNNLDLDSVDIVANIVNENDASLIRKKRSIIDEMEPLHTNTNLFQCNKQLYPKPSMINGLMKCSDLVIDRSESSSDDESDINEKSDLKLTNLKFNKINNNNNNINNNKECNATRRRHNLYMSSSSSSSSCSSIEKIYELTYKKYNVLQIQSEDHELMQPEPIRSNNLLTTTAITSGTMGSGSSGKLQRSIAKMKILFSTNDVPQFPGDDGQDETDYMDTFIVNSGHSLSESSSSTSTNSKNSMWSAGSNEL